MRFLQTSILVTSLAAGAVCQPVKAHELGQSHIDPAAIGQSRAAAEAYYDLADATAAGYEPQADGSMHLVALEYIVFKAQWHGSEAPSFLGQELKLKSKVGVHPVDPYYELHVWHWRSNPSGMMADNNRSVSCAHSR